MIQVVFWFYNLSITFASVVVCMHANFGPEAKYFISDTWDTPHRGGVLQLYIVMPNPFVGF